MYDSIFFSLFPFTCISTITDWPNMAYLDDKKNIVKRFEDPKIRWAFFYELCWNFRTIYAGLETEYE